MGEGGSRWADEGDRGHESAVPCPGDWCERDRGRQEAVDMDAKDKKKSAISQLSQGHRHKIVKQEL